MKSKQQLIGGQAVIEGFIMRGLEYIATAVRAPSGEIIIKREPVKSGADWYPFLKKPFIRGVVSLVESLIYGIKVLSFSAQVSREEGEELSSKKVAVTMLMSLGLAILLFMVILTYAVEFPHSAMTEP